VVVQATNLSGSLLDDRLSERHLAVSGQYSTPAVSHRENGCAVNHLFSDSTTFWNSRQARVPRFESEFLGDDSPPHMDDRNLSNGYVTDSGYADTFFRELSPVWLNYVARLNGTPPRDLDAAFAYLELGCGLGSSAIVNAGAFPHGEFHACDIN